MKKLNLSVPLSKGTQITWWICRGLLLCWGIAGLLFGYPVMFTQSLFAIAFTHLWDMFQLFGGKSFITRVPAYLQTELNIFICFGCVVGSTVNDFTDFAHIDLPEHAIAGFLACTFGFILCDLMQGQSRHIKPAVQAMFGFAFGVALMVGWEFYEFTMDRLYGFNMQHSYILQSDGLIDTMVDLIVGTAGSLTAMFIEGFRKVGRFGKDKEKKRAEYLKDKEEAKKEKELIYYKKQIDFEKMKR